jgi:hypothetical protein
MCAAPFSRQVHIDFEPSATGGDWTLARVDGAMTLLDVAEDSRTIGRALGVSGAKPLAKRRLEVRQAIPGRRIGWTYT